MLSEVLSQKALHNVTMVEPGVIKYADENGEIKYATLGVEALRYIYNHVGFTFTFSKQLFKLSPEIWSEVMKTRLDDRDLIEDLSTYMYSICNNCIISILERGITDGISVIDNCLSEYDYKMFMNKNGVLQFIVSANDNRVENKNTPVILLDMDIVNGKYFMYDAVISDNYDLIVSSKPTMVVYSLEEFINTVELRTEIGLMKKLGDQMLQDFNYNEANSKILSLREVLDIIKYSGCDVELNSEGFVNYLQGIKDDDFSNEISEFLNSFKTPYKSLKKFKYLRKSLKYSTMTLGRFLHILSLEFSNPENNINADLISYFLRTTYYSKESDKEVLSEEIK